uniref:Uncharacterized protein n=1 Tax=viral metagenome TaxID=1070528 RepID=A0A6H2A2D3_9ZZZZ
MQDREGFDMQNQKETIRINRENDDSYVIIRTITEKVDAEALVRITDEIKKGIEAMGKKLDDAKAQHEMISSREGPFMKHYERAKKMADKKAEERKKESLPSPKGQQAEAEPPAGDEYE